MATPQRILIVGAGVAGLSLAAKLGGSRSHWQLVEQSDGPRCDGTGITISFNGARALGHIGCLDDVKQQSQPITRVTIAGQNGRALETLDLRSTQRRFGSTFAVRRSVVHAALAAQVKTPIRYGTTVAAIDQSADRIAVTFADESVETFDVVVGADGARSRVRSCVFPGSAFKENGIYCWRFVAPDRRRRREVVEFLGVGRRVGVIPLRGAETYVFATCERELLAHRGSGSPEQLRRLFAHFPPPIPDLISGPLDALHFEALGSSVWPCFTRGRVVLIGDAAHAMGPDLAQGASLAMEDAIVLAASLRTESDLASALQIYEGRRVARVGRFAVATKIIGRAAHVTEPLARCVRDRMLYSGLMANWVVSGLLAWGMLDGHDEGTGSAHPTTQ